MKGARSRPGRRALLCLLLCGVYCATLFDASLAQAQRRRGPWLDVTEIHGEAAVEVGYDTESRDTTGQTSVDQEEVLVQEELKLGGSGWIYHPALLDVDATFGVLFNQDFADNKRGESSETTLNQFDYDVRLGILPYKPYPVSLFASQLRSQVDSPFTPRREVDTFRYGAALALQQLAVGELKVPTRMMYRHQETETSSFSSGSDNFRERDEVEVVMDNKTARTRNRARYNWKSLASESRGAKTDSSRHDVRLFQEREFDRGSLSSQFFLAKNIGTFDTLSLSVNENLGLAHDHSFNSSYGYAFSYQETEGLEQAVHSGTAGISHQLYESLSSSAQINSTYSDSDIGTIWAGGGGGQLGYKKKIPGGSFGLRFAPTYLYTDEDIESGISSTFGERQEVQVATNIILNNRLVLTSSILIFDPATDIPFIEGVDYTVVPLGERTAIQVIPGSDLDPLIPPLITQMAVNYDYRLEPSLTFSTLTLLSGFSLDLWDHLSGDVSYTKTEQELLEGERGETRLDDSRRLRARVEVNFDHSRTRFEYERLRSSINPRERYSVTQDFSHRLGRRTSVGVGASYDHDRVMDPNRVTQAVSASGNMTTVLPFAVLARLNVVYRWIDQVEQRSQAIGPNLALSYRYGMLRFQLTDRLSWRRTKAKSGSGRTTREVLNTVFFRIERPF